MPTRSTGYSSTPMASTEDVKKFVSSKMKLCVSTACLIIADKMRKVAERLGDSNYTVWLTEIEEMGKVPNGKKTFFFWANTIQVNGLLINPSAIN